MATIITTHMPTDVAAASRVCPGIRIQFIDSAQPPGIGISPIEDIDAEERIVKVTLAAYSSAEMLRNVCSDTRPWAMWFASPA
jgi:hypothetical protein